MYLNPFLIQSEDKRYSRQKAAADVWAMKAIFCSQKVTRNPILPLVRHIVATASNNQVSGDERYFLAWNHPRPGPNLTLRDTIQFVAESRLYRSGGGADGGDHGY